MPSEVRYPGPLSRPCMDTPRSPLLRRTAVSFQEKCGVPPRLGEEKTSNRAPLLFSKLGSHSAFLLERDRGPSEKLRARGVHAGTSERAGLVTSLGTKPPLYFKRTLR